MTTDRYECKRPEKDPCLVLVLERLGGRSCREVGRTECVDESAAEAVLGHTLELVRLANLGAALESYADGVGAEVGLSRGAVLAGLLGGRRPVPPNTVADIPAYVEAVKRHLALLGCGDAPPPARGPFPPPAGGPTPHNTKLVHAGKPPDPPGYDPVTLNALPPDGPAGPTSAAPGHVWRAPLPDEPREEGAVCVNCGTYANAEGGKPCPRVGASWRDWPSLL